MAAAQSESRRSARSPLAAPARQGLRSQMRITKKTQTVAAEKAAVKQEIKKEITHEQTALIPPAAAPAAAAAATTVIDDVKPPPSPTSPAAKPRKPTKKQTKHTTETPFPNFPRPTVQDCRLAHSILTTLHGPRTQPAQVVASAAKATCGASPSVLDALVRTILSQNTSALNADRAKRGMDAVYGGPAQWHAVHAGGQPKLQRAIRSGGLSAVKSRVIIDVLARVRGRYGVFSLDHLFEASDAEAMEELLAFPGVGPKTASCVLLFCLQRPSFAVDTHVYRVTGFMGWRPAGASREQAQAHLDARVPDELKYALHVLLITHGKTCSVCSAKGVKGGHCKLREAFKK